MSQELTQDLAGWWNEQSFEGKELFRLEENGDLVLLPTTYVKERIIATVTADSAEAVVKNLLDKFSSLEARVRELEVEWLSTEDKLKVADKVEQLKETLQKSQALGNFEKLGALVHDWQHTLYQLTEEHYAAKLKLAEQAEAMATSEEWKNTSQFFRDVTDLWRQCGYVDKNRNEKLWARVETARKAFHDRKRVHHEEEEKDLLVNLDLKLDLVEQAESLAASADWKKTTETFHRLTEEWKTIGHTHNKKNEELWQRFLKAKSTFFDAKRGHYNMVQTEQEANFAVKLSIVERAEALRSSTEWNATAQAYAALMEEWKKTGRVPQVKADELWKRFTEAQEEFFEAKRKHTDTIRGEQEQNLVLKRDILDRVLKLQYSNHWGETTTELNELMDEWKKIGPVPRAYSDKMWEELNAARRNFFARKDANREQRKQYAEEQKVHRIANAKNLVVKLQSEIQEEQDKIADFKNALLNISPGKKAEELKNHLEHLIEECGRNAVKLQERLAHAIEDAKLADAKAETSASENTTA